MKPNTKFDFNVAELEIVESAMKYRMSRLLARSKTVVKESSRVKIDAEIKHIYTLLGKIPRGVLSVEGAVAGRPLPSSRAGRERRMP